jgi:putative solute:sodium symporter small subunit
MSTETTSGMAYWKANVRLISICLVIWAVCSYGFGIILRPALSGIKIGGTDIGFWFAQQGSMIVFLVLIFYYAYKMNQLDRQFDVHED